MPVWNDKMAGQETANGQVFINSALTWSLLLCNAYQFCSSNVWVLQYHCVHTWDMSTIIVFVYLELQFQYVDAHSGVNKLCGGYLFGNHEHISNYLYFVPFCHTFQNGADSWNPSPWKSRIYLFLIPIHGCWQSVQTLDQGIGRNWIVFACC